MFSRAHGIYANVQIFLFTSVKTRYGFITKKRWENCKVQHRLSFFMCIHANVTHFSPFLKNVNRSQTVDLRNFFDFLLPTNICCLLSFETCCVIRLINVSRFTLSNSFLFFSLVSSFFFNYVRSFIF